MATMDVTRAAARLALTGMVLLGAASVSGCALVGMGYGPFPPGGTAFSSVGMMEEFEPTLAGAAGKKAAKGKLKTGEACSANYLALISTGDASIAAAAQAGGIKTVTSVDFRRSSLFAWFGYYCTVVRGYG